MSQETKPAQAEAVQPATQAPAVEKTTTAAPVAAAAAPAPSQAPAGLFESPIPSAGSDSPERVRIITAQLNEYVEGMGTSQADRAKMRKSMTSAIAAVRLMKTLSGPDLVKALDAMVAAIKACSNGAFHESRIFSQIDLIPGLERDSYVKLVGTMVTYTKLEDKTRIHDTVSLGYIAEIFPEGVTRKSFLSYFPKK